MIAAYVAGHKEAETILSVERRVDRDAAPAARVRALVRHERHHARRRRAFHFVVNNAADSILRPHEPLEGELVPVIVTPAIARAAGPSGIVPLHVENSVDHRRRSSRRRSYFPSIDGDAVVADLPTWLAAANTVEPGVATASELWLDARPPAGAAARTSPRSARASHELTSDPLARGAIALLLVTALVGAGARRRRLAAHGRRRPARGARLAARSRGAGRDSRRSAPARAAARGRRRRARPRRRHRRGRDRRRARRRGRHGHRRRRGRVAAARAHLRLAARRSSCSRRSPSSLGGARDGSGAEASMTRRRGARSLPALRVAEGTSVALQGLTLDVAVGELLVVFGPSGSGKSTLLRILAGLDRPSAGTVSVFGHDLRTLRGRGLVEYRSRTLGYADQHYARALAPELTARQLVALRLALLGVDARGARARRRQPARARRAARPARRAARGALRRPAAARRDLRGARAPAAALHRRRADRRARRRERGARSTRSSARSRARSARRRSSSATIRARPRSPTASCRSATAASASRTARRSSTAAAGSASRRSCSAAPRARSVERVPEGVVLRVRERAAAPEPRRAAVEPGEVVVADARPREGLRRREPSSAISRSTFERGGCRR